MIGREDLIANKRATGRPRTLRISLARIGGLSVRGAFDSDLIDIQRLLSTPGRERASLPGSTCVVGGPRAVLLYVLAFVDRQVINLMVAPIGSNSGSATRDQPPGGVQPVFYVLRDPDRAARTRGAADVIAAGLAIWSATSAACGLARTYAQLLLARMESASARRRSRLPPIADRRRVPAEAARRGDGRLSMGSYLGAGSPARRVLDRVHPGARTHEVSPRRGASWARLPARQSPGLALVPLLATVVEPARRGLRLSPEAAAAPLPFRATWQNFRENAAAFLCHNLGFALLAFSGYGSGAWTPTFLQRNHGMSAADSGIALGWIMATAGTLGIVFGGWLADRLARAGGATRRCAWG